MPAQRRAPRGRDRIDSHLREADALSRPAPSPLRAGPNPPYGVRLETRTRWPALIPQIGRCAEAALRGLDCVPPDRRSAPSGKLIDLKPLEANAALQRRHRMPPVPLRDRARGAAARARAAGAAGPDVKIAVSTAKTSSTNAMPMLPARHYESEHTRIHSRDEGTKQPGLEQQSSGKPGLSGGTSVPRSCNTKRNGRRPRSRRRAMSITGQD